MWLFIDTSEVGRIRFGLLKSDRNHIWKVVARSGSLLPRIAMRIGLATVKKVKGVVVVSGPGSFSSVRGGVIVANLLSRFLSVPIIGITQDQAVDFPALTRRVFAGELSPTQFVAPIYSQEPNITVARETCHIKT
ncbi:MAG: hypothetical protein AAB386_02910 [Patescibacteria group bacterium]